MCFDDSRDSFGWEMEKRREDRVVKGPAIKIRGVTVGWWSEEGKKSDAF